MYYSFMLQNDSGITHWFRQSIDLRCPDTACTLTSHPRGGWLPEAALPTVPVTRPPLPSLLPRTVVAGCSKPERRAPTCGVDLGRRPGRRSRASCSSWRRASDRMAHLNGGVEARRIKGGSSRVLHCTVVLVRYIRRSVHHAALIYRTF